MGHTRSWIFHLCKADISNSSSTERCYTYRYHCVQLNQNFLEAADLLQGPSECSHMHKKCCKWWCVRGWQTSSIDIFAAEAGLEAVDSSDIPSKAILSIKALVTDLHIRISVYEIHRCQEIWQGLQIHADLVQNTVKCKGGVSVALTPVQNF